MGRPVLAALGTELELTADLARDGDARRASQS